MSPSQAPAGPGAGLPQAAPTAPPPGKRAWARWVAFRPGLLTRMVVALAAVGLVPLGFAAWRLTTLTERAMIEQVLRAQAVAASTAAERADAFLAARRTLLAGAAGNPALGEPDSAAAGEHLSRSLGAWSGLGVAAVGLYNGAGQEVLRAQLAASSERQPVARLLASPLRRPAAGGAEPAAESDTEPATATAGPGRLWVRLAVPLPGIPGSLRLVADGAGLTRAVFSPELGGQAELALVDPRRQVLAGPPAALAGYPPRLVANALSGKVVGVQRRFEGADGATFLGAYAPLREAPWAVLARQSTPAAEALALAMRRSARASLAASAALIALVVTVAWRTVVHPIRRLAEAQRRLGGLPASARRSDEVADLRESFAVLERRLADREALDRVFLGRYQVLELAGGGGMGTVFKGWDPRLQRTVALKTVRLAASLTDEQRGALRAGLLKEALAIARLTHPNIVAVYDVEDAAEGAYLALEYVEGCTLADFLAQRGPLSADQVIALGAAIARALAAAHGRGIVHRDLKPANVLLGSDGAVKLTDFGIAELVSAAEGPSPEEEPERVYGTPGYLPPETLYGEGFGTAGDLFSLGALLHEALTGTPLFGSGPADAVVSRTLAARIRPPGATVADVPPDLDRLILRLLAHRPQERPAGAAEVADQLERLQRDRGLRGFIPGELAAVPKGEAAWAAAQWVGTRPMG